MGFKIPMLQWKCGKCFVEQMIALEFELSCLMELINLSQAVILDLFQSFVSELPPKWPPSILIFLLFHSY